MSYIKCTGCKTVYESFIKSSKYEELTLVNRSSRTWSPYCCGHDFEPATEQEAEDYNEYLKELRKSIK